MKSLPLITSILVLSGCGGDNKPGASTPDAALNQPDASAVEQPAASCRAGTTATQVVSAPVLEKTITDGSRDGWLASPSVADLDGDGTPEIILARSGRLSVWHADATKIWSASVGGRIWASPIVADLSPSSAGLEVAIASQAQILVYSANGELLPGYPFQWRGELRSIAAGDIDNDGQLELVAVTTSPLQGGGQRDIIIAIEVDSAQAISGFPPNTNDSGCDDACYVTGGYDQNLAIGDIDGDGAADIFATQDNAYLSLHHGDGSVFPAASIFSGRSFFPGIRMLHDLANAKQGWAEDEESANQAHFTNSAPAIADVDGDGNTELVVLGSVQNASQSDRKRGVGLWLLHKDGTRLSGWETPFHAQGFLGGLWDFDNTNVVAATNQVSVVDLDPEKTGLEMIFAGFDGTIHAVSADKQEFWSYRYTQDARVLTGGVAVADLSDDGRPEIIFASYSPDTDKSHLFILDSGGAELHKVPLPDRGSMAVPTIADTDGDGDLEIVLDLKSGEDNQAETLIYSVAGAGNLCNLWSTGRGGLLRNGYVPPVNN